MSGNVEDRVFLRPIGYVSSPIKGKRKGGFDDIEAEIVIDEDLVEGLEGMEDFSHIEVIYYLHMNETGGDWSDLSLKIHPMGRHDLPLVGLFTTRTPHRPNPIALTLCELVSIERNVLSVKGLDALDRSPVLDLKGPSLRYREKGDSIIYPEWTDRVREIIENRKRERSMK